MLLAACNDANTRPQIDIEGKTMGTFYSVKVSGTITESKQQLQQEIDALLEQANDDISTYRPDSVLSRFNQNTTAEPQPIPVEWPISSSPLSALAVIPEVLWISPSALWLTCGASARISGPSKSPASSRSTWLASILVCNI